MPAFLAIVTLSGCASLDGAALKRSALRAASDTRTWAPALGAAVFAAGDWDRKVSRWAVEQQPLFGSQEAAMNAGDDLRNLAAAGALVTVFVAPGDTTSRLVAQTGAHFAAVGTTWTLKHGIERPRPDGSDAQSFPSGHATSAFADATLAQRNIDTLDLPQPERLGLNAGFDALAAGTAWARLEAGEHYPSDVLAGAAIGHFMATVVTDAFLHDARIGFLPSRHGSRLEFSFAF